MTIRLAGRVDEDGNGRYDTLIVETRRIMPSKEDQPPPDLRYFTANQSETAMAAARPARPQ
jgi:hypothetical protein